MSNIILTGVIPEIFADRKDLKSDVWNTDLRFEQGKTYLIEADSGTGKSSLCSYIYGLRGDYRGKIELDGHNIKRFSTNKWCDVRQSQISILFQDLRLFGELTAMENIQIKHRLSKIHNKRIITAWFEQLGIADKINTRIDHMSYGQQQRVALIRALCQRFNFLVLDEPISHLDDRNSDIMRDIILAEVSRQGAALITTSIGKHMNIDYDKRLSL
ncbi:MAG: ATP-binding cassette domain-containing protein [Alistipes sp.]|nr:ATP-binding cassette domain-containing protein [Alistipes sp.]